MLLATIRGIMSPLTIYQAEGSGWLNRLAEVSGINRKYLYQCATGRRQPSPEYARRMIAADNRLTLDEIYKVGTEDTPPEPPQTLQRQAA
jgi:hypothetical protein